jgi:plasmid stabilization system protein ParE
MSSGYAFHPEAFADLDDIRDYIAQENPDAADRVMSEIFDAIRGLVPFPIRATGAGPQFAAIAVHSCT